MATQITNFSVRLCIVFVYHETGAYSGYHYAPIFHLQFYLEFFKLSRNPQGVFILHTKIVEEELNWIVRIFHIILGTFLPNRFSFL